MHFTRGPTETIRGSHQAFFRSGEQLAKRLGDAIPFLARGAKSTCIARMLRDFQRALDRTSWIQWNLRARSAGKLEPRPRQ